MRVPEQGQLVSTRNRFFIVQDVTSHSDDVSNEILHFVTLECLDEDRMGEELRVIWEREPKAETFDVIGFPRPDNWDSFDRFIAFIHAVNWSTSSRLARTEGIISAPFRSDVKLEEFQLEPVARSLMMPRVNLLIADDVGLGKTIEAGLVMQELIAQQRVRRVLIVCPASLQNQWREEMEEKFQLPFMIIDRSAIQQLRREYGVHVNPWSSYPRIITSIDFLKREQPLQTFTAAQMTSASSILREWNLLILDEAHNVSPSGRRTYVRDSARTKMAREIVNHFEHRLFLTATPHNGYTESFTALLEILDPLRFSRGPYIDDLSQLNVVLVRRLKEDIMNALGEQAFAPRRVKSLEIQYKLGNDHDRNETRLYQLLKEYTASRLANANGKERLATRFTLTLLKKRLLSSPRAFDRTLSVHLDHLQTGEGDLDLLKRLHDRSLEDWDDDQEKNQTEEDALAESSKFFLALTQEERSLLEEMKALSTTLAADADRKAKRLVSWIEENMRVDGEWGDERLIVFTEYKDTLNYLHELFIKHGYEECVLVLYGGMGLDAREMIKQNFQMHPSANPVRILLSTDAASEGLNLQNHCRNLIHYEIPWNPNRLEQRNGRIDRHGQTADEVRIFHFVYTRGSEDDAADSRARDYEFLRKVVEKIQRIRTELGAVGDVIARKVEDAMIGEGNMDVDSLEMDERREVVKRQLQADLKVRQRIGEIKGKILTARNALGLNEQNMRRVLHEALRIQDPRNDGLIPVTEGDLAGKGYRLRSLPATWSDCRSSIRDKDGRELILAFQRSHAAERKDTVYVHLNHPLMRRALGTFRKNMWSERLHEEQRLNRVSYIVVPEGELTEPALVAYGRIIATGSKGQKLHEAILPCAWNIHGEDLTPLDISAIEPLIRKGDGSIRISNEVRDRLTTLFPSHEMDIQNAFEIIQKEESERVAKVLEVVAEKDAADVAKLLEDRVKEIDARLERFKEATWQKTLIHFVADEVAQYEDDLHWLEERRKKLKEDVKSEPERVKSMLELRQVRVFPLGILYLIPATLAGGDR